MFTTLSSPAGRIGRPAYFRLMGLLTIIYALALASAFHGSFLFRKVIITVIAVTSYRSVSMFEGYWKELLIFVSFSLPFAGAAINLTIKRLHDMDMSAWHLAWVVPCVNAPVYALLLHIFANGPTPRKLLWAVAGAAAGWMIFGSGSEGKNSYGTPPDRLYSDNDLDEVKREQRVRRYY